MPKLIEYISVGVCSGYGDGDYRVSASVKKMSKKEFDNLKLTTLHAIMCAEELWRAGQNTSLGAKEITAE